MSHHKTDESEFTTPSKKPKLTTESETDSPVVSQDVSEASFASDASPNRSRYGRSHKPKSPGDFLSHDKRISGVMKISPFNQLQFYTFQKRKKKVKNVKRNSNQLFDENSENETETGNTGKDELNIIEEEYLKTWLIGDLVWAKIGKHPYWPAMIASDPDAKTIYTHLRKRRPSHLEIHVQFFADNGRRGWVSLSNILLFEGRQEFFQLQEKIKKTMKLKDFRKSGLFIKPSLDSWWNSAGVEAESQMSYTRDQRMDYFNDVLSSLKKNKKSLETPKSTPNQKMNTKSTVVPEASKKRKRSEDGVPVGNPSKQPKLEGKIEDSKKAKLEDPKKAKLEDPKKVKSEDPKKVKSEDPKKVNKEVNEEKIPQPTTPLRTIADRKKRQATLLELARSCGVISPNQKRTKENAKEATPEVVKPQKPKVTKTPANKEIKSDVKEAKKKTKNKKQGNDFNFYCSKYFTRTKEDYPDLTEKEIYRLLEKRWNDMNESQRSRYKSRLTTTQETMLFDSDDSVSVVSGISENCDQNSESATEPIAAATSKGGVGKRFMSLFSGAKAEKACLICEKPGITVRCRGPCNGNFHLECVIKKKNNPDYKVQEVEVKKIKVKKGKLEKIFLRNIEEPSTSRDNNLSVALPDDYNDTTAPETDSLEIGSPDTVSQSQNSSSNESLENGEKIKSRKGSKDSDSSEDGEYFRCPDCVEGKTQPCFVCNSYADPKNKSTKMSRCHTSRCGKVYHLDCLKAWPQTTWSAGNSRRGNGRTEGEGVMNCPQHCCHTCVSDNPAVVKARYANDKIVRCIRCPTAYHHGNYCIPAGSEIITQTQIICPVHYKPTKKGISHVNAAWCFICASGGSLICCDLCPNAFHADCLNIPPPDGSYICEDCQTGRFPLYGEIVWVKLGSYRWWPAEILYPVQVPENIQNLPHVRGEFAVRFFGSHDYYWVNRGRVFLLHENDNSTKTSKKSSVDNTYARAVQEALAAHERYKADKALRDAEVRYGMKPPSYIKIKANKCVGNVKPVEFNISNVNTCECKPESKNPCARDSDCLNRLLNMECNPLVCPAGERCNNQLFEKRVYPALQPFQTETRGWGLKTLENIKKGDFVIEYVGEMIDEAEYKKRLARLHAANDENYYFLTVDKDRKLDAGPKGNVSRFMNHSCNPNCETQKWTVNLDTRIGLFALTDIPAGSELVFNYKLKQFGDGKLPCMCGAFNCSGFIGSKAGKITTEEEKKVKPIKKKIKAPNKVSEEECFICHDTGELILCDNKTCPKAYHLNCLKKARMPIGKGFWVCPWHHCTICNKGRVRRCSLCINSYCQDHSEGNIRLHEEEGLLCNRHYKEGITGGTSITTSSSKPTKDQLALKGEENIYEETSEKSAPVVLENSDLKEDKSLNIDKSDETVISKKIAPVVLENSDLKEDKSLNTEKPNETVISKKSAPVVLQNSDLKEDKSLNIEKPNETVISKKSALVVLENFNTKEDKSISIEKPDETVDKSNAILAEDEDKNIKKFDETVHKTNANIIRFDNVGIENKKNGSIELNFVSSPVVNGTIETSDITDNEPKNSSESIVNNTETDITLSVVSKIENCSSSEQKNSSKSSAEQKDKGSSSIGKKVMSSSITEEKITSSSSTEEKDMNTSSNKEKITSSSSSSVEAETIEPNNGTNSMTENNVNCQKLNSELTTIKVDASKNSDKKVQKLTDGNEPMELDESTIADKVLDTDKSSGKKLIVEGKLKNAIKDDGVEVDKSSSEENSISEASNVNISADLVKETDSDVAKEVANDNDSTESEYLVLHASDSLSVGSGEGDKANNTLSDVTSNLIETVDSTLNKSQITLVDETVTQSSSSITVKQGTVTLNDVSSTVDENTSSDSVVALIKMNVNKSEHVSKEDNICHSSLMNESDNLFNTELIDSPDSGDDIISNQNNSINR